METASTCHRTQSYLRRGAGYRRRLRTAPGHYARTPARFPAADRRRDHARHALDDRARSHPCRACGGSLPSRSLPPAKEAERQEGGHYLLRGKYLRGTPATRSRPAVTLHTAREVMNDNTCLTLLGFASIKRIAKMDRCKVLQPRNLPTCRGF